MSYFTFLFVVVLDVFPSLFFVDFNGDVALVNFLIRQVTPFFMKSKDADNIIKIIKIYKIIILGMLSLVLGDFGSFCRRTPRSCHRGQRGTISRPR